MPGGVHGRVHAWQGAVHGRGHVWWGACMAGGMHGGGMCMVGGCEWWWWACMAGGHACHTCPPHNEIQSVNALVVRILLECILVISKDPHSARIP